MKTFNCTQCGASIKRISLKDRWAHCDYCKASFLIPEEKRPVVTGLSFSEIRASDPDSDDGIELGPLGKAVGVVVLLVLIVFGGIEAQDQIRAHEESDRKAKETRVREENKVTNVPVSVDWDGGSGDVLHYQLPTISTIAFAVVRGLDKPPGTKQTVVIRVTIDQEGNVSGTEVLYGNVMLHRIAADAAGMTVFSPGSRKRTRKITYTFG